MEDCIAGAAWALGAYKAASSVNLVLESGICALGFLSVMRIDFSDCSFGHVQHHNGVLG
jgi:hypothetical protein